RRLSCYSPSSFKSGGIECPLFPGVLPVGRRGSPSKGGSMKVRVLFGVVLALALAGIAGGPSVAAGASTASPGADPGVGNVPQGTQAAAGFGASVPGGGVWKVCARARRGLLSRARVAAGAVH